jgi:hypothetical protein
MIKFITGFPGDVIAFECDGRVARRDYENTLVPAVEAALSRYEKVRLYYQTGHDFSGVEPAYPMTLSWAWTICCAGNASPS